MKDLFTTGEAAEVCKVSQQTIIRCFDSGRVEGFRIPGSRFRRIPRQSLIKFMKENNIPLDNIDSGRKKVLIVDDDSEIVELVADVLVRDGRFDIKTAASGYEAGIQTEQFRPDLAQRVAVPIEGRAPLLSIARARGAFGYAPQYRLGD